MRSASEPDTATRRNRESPRSPTIPSAFRFTPREKFAPWAAPIVEAIKERIGTAAFEIALKKGDIEMVPFEVMRGRSWKSAFVLLDEAQNSTPAEIKMFLTRIGEDCTVVINGDVSQHDLDWASGLMLCTRRS